MRNINQYPRMAAIAWCISAASPLGLLAWSSSAHAQGGAACRPGGTVAEVNACAVQEFQEADTTNQILYGDVMRALAEHERPLLRREQSAWMRERTMQCKKETQSSETQPEGPRLFYQCQTRKTQERRKGLMRWLSADSPAS